jgi:magnesium-transporting ATPase (P-type)
VTRADPERPAGGELPEGPPTTAAPWAERTEVVAAGLGVDPARGLTSAVATTRLAAHGPNRLDDPPPVPRWRRLLAQFQDPLVYLLLAAAAISTGAWLIEGADGVPFEVIVIVAVLVANALLGHVQEARAEKAVAALNRLSAAHAGVVRDGEVRRVPAAEVVPGDVLVLGEGDAVAADARLVDAEALAVAEASLTGESEAVAKGTDPVPTDAALGDRAGMVFTGTSVTRGRGRAVVTTTGMATEMGHVARLLAATEDEPTPLQREVAAIGRTLGIAVVLIAVVVVATILATSEVDTAADLVDVLLVGVSLAVAAVPEGLPAVLSVVLALGVQRMARERAIVKRLASVETLGSASVVCTDKTGTLTRNEMTVTTVATGSGTVELTGTGYRPDGGPRAGGRALTAEHDAALLDEARLVVGAGSLANDATLREEGGEWTVQGDPTDGAFLVGEAKLGGRDAARFRRVGEIPFTSERRMMTTFEADGARGDRLVVVTKGAPDAVLARCSHERVAGEVRPLSDARRAAIAATVDGLADRALRTLAVAHRPLPGATAADLPGGDEPGARREPDALDALERDLVWLGLVGMLDPPRESARAAVAEAHAAGVRIVMITGDHPRTAARIAADLGIAPAGAAVGVGADLEDLDDDALRVSTRLTSVYARVAPHHKLRLVDALQADGNIVAMTGDGVNDAPALRSADIGVAMGITGTDVSKEAADMILADDNFATIVVAIREGRGIFANIRAFLRYLLSSNAGEVFTMFLGVAAAGVIGLGAGEAVAVPLLATQILWINLLTDTGPALAMGVDPPPDDVMVRPPRRLTDRVVDAEMQVGVVVVGLTMAVAALAGLDLYLPGGLVEGSGGLTEARTVAFTTLVLAQLWNCFNARSDRASFVDHLFTNPLLWVAIAVSLALQVAVVHVPVLNEAFETTPLSLGAWALCAALGATVLVAGELTKVVLRRRARLSRAQPASPPRDARTAPGR